MDKREIVERPMADEKTIRPYYLVCEEKGNLLLKLEMPGVTKNSLSIHVDGNQLQVSGKREPEGLEKVSFLIQERRQGNYYCEYTMDDTIDTSKIDAVMERGLVNIVLPIKEAEKPRKIEIKTS